MSLFLFSCEPISNDKSSKIIFKPENIYKNLGFALVYKSNLENIKELETRSLNIYQKKIKKKIICQNFKSCKWQVLNCRG